MRTAAVIFTILGIAVDFAAGPIPGVIGMLFAIWPLYGLINCKKNIVCGILSIFLTGVLGGVFYLAWDGKEKPAKPKTPKTPTEGD